MNQQNLVLTLLQNLILCSQTQFIPSEMYQIPNLYIYQELMSIYKLKMFIFKEAFTQYFVRLRVILPLMIHSPNRLALWQERQGAGEIQERLPYLISNRKEIERHGCQVQSTQTFLMRDNSNGKQLMIPLHREFHSLEKLSNSQTVLVFLTGNQKTMTGPSGLDKKKLTIVLSHLKVTKALVFFSRMMTELVICSYKT